MSEADRVLEELCRRLGHDWEYKCDRMSEATTAITVEAKQYRCRTCGKWEERKP